MLRDADQLAPSVQLGEVVGADAAVDGSAVVAEGGRLVRVSADGKLTWIAGDGTTDEHIPAPPTSPDGTRAATARIRPTYVALAADGTILFIERTRGLRVIDAGGALRSVALPPGAVPISIAVAPDGDLLVTDITGRLWRLGTEPPKTVVDGKVSELREIEDGRPFTGGHMQTSAVTFTVDGSMVLAGSGRVLMISSSMPAPWLAAALERPTSRALASGMVPIRTSQPATLTVSVFRAAVAGLDIAVARGAPIVTGRGQLDRGPGVVRLNNGRLAGLLMVRVTARGASGQITVHDRVVIAGERLPDGAAQLAAAFAADEDLDGSGYIRDCQRRTARAIDCNAAWLEDDPDRCCAARYRARWRADGRVTIRRFRLAHGQTGWIGPARAIRLR